MNFNVTVTDNKHQISFALWDLQNTQTNSLHVLLHIPVTIIKKNIYIRSSSPSLHSKLQTTNSLKKYRKYRVKNIVGLDVKLQKQHLSSYFYSSVPPYIGSEYSNYKPSTLLSYFVISLLLFGIEDFSNVKT